MVATLDNVLCPTLTIKGADLPMLLMFDGVMAARSLTCHPDELCEQLQGQFSS